MRLEGVNRSRGLCRKATCQSCEPIPGHPRVGHDQGPKYLVLGVRGVNRGDPHAGHGRIEQVCPMRRRITPAGERLCKGVVTRPHILDGGLGGEPRAGNPLIERAGGVLIELVTLSHGARLLAREPHQVGVQGNRAEAVVVAVAGNHGLSRRGVYLGTRACQALIEARLRWWSLSGTPGKREARQDNRSYAWMHPWSFV